MRNFLRLLPAIFILPLLLGCNLKKKINNDPNAVEPAQASVMSYFISEQYNFSNATQIAAMLSSFSGRAMVATAESTFERWRNPSLGCMYALDDVVNVTGTRPIDVGLLRLRDSSGVTLSIDPTPNSFIFSFDGLLLPGPIALSTSGQNGIALEQSFTVPGPGSNVVLDSSAYTFPEALSMPRIPSDSGDPANDAENFYVGVARNAELRVSYTAPASTNYVRVTFSDGSSNSAYNIVCYGSKNGPIQVPAGAFSHFRATSDGLMTIDFVSISFRRDISRVKESVILSYSRQIHGRKDLATSNGLQPAYFGALYFQ